MSPPLSFFYVSVEESLLLLTTRFNFYWDHCKCVQFTRIASSWERALPSRVTALEEYHDPWHDPNRWILPTGYPWQVVRAIEQDEQKEFSGELGLVPDAVRITE